MSATLLSLLRSVCLRYKSVTVPDRVVSTSLTVLSSGTSKSFDFATEKMMADIFTKPLGKSAYLRCRDYLMTAIGKIA